ncbi:neuronal acetylcholine receptor subunit alpha-5 [Elysia marginata]|uniref:Neuronal acetylcholine receptor subunit alpha-5 n=2 Tax=Elysia marginata TaxID=1093978 RepID=A0AAV4IAY4_9GAST|nr:neuronal acetylcholine receptor subunit alpha-5 [Elysia marginata]
MDLRNTYSDFDERKLTDFSVFLYFLWRCAASEGRGRSKLVRRRRDMSYEDMLVNEVLESYKKRTTHARPVKNFNDTITVRFAIQLTQIMGLDEQDQILTLNFWDQLVSRTTFYGLCGCACLLVSVVISAGKVCLF